MIVFTEYRDTQKWLHDLLLTHDFGGHGGERIALLYGGMEEKRREQTKAEFQADPSRSPVRILLATDAASEGIDLQRHCWRLLHWEIPWNPSRLEQRNGRVDRHGQPSPVVEVRHFVPEGWDEQQPGFASEMGFLSLVARKVEQIREDLGSVGLVPSPIRSVRPCSVSAVASTKRNSTMPAAGWRQACSGSSESFAGSLTGATRNSRRPSTSWVSIPNV